ncbi:MAG: methyltransferase domain-containing protein [Betaproteobacteria bacterium]
MSVEHKGAVHSREADIEDFLRALREFLLVNHANLLPLYDTFAQESRFARAWIAPSLVDLQDGSEILEVGAGLMLLSCQLQREGFFVTALEPIEGGFSMFSELQGVVLQYADKNGFAPRLFPIAAEELQTEKVFAFAYSVNVMEHVRSVPRALERICRSLVVGGEYRFTCPNYYFPYEPHFNIPIILSKRITKMVFSEAILRSSRVTDPIGTWASLNWINVRQIQHIVDKTNGLTLRFDRDLIVHTLERVALDPDFAKRRSAWVRAVIGTIVKLGIHRFTRFVPALLQPIIDCRIKRHCLGKEC